MPAPPAPVGAVLACPAWAQWQERRTGLSLVPLTFGGPGEAMLSATLFCSSRGRVVTPSLAPYTAVVFRPTTTTRHDRVVRQWEDLAGTLADELRRRGVSGYLDLPPELTDARPFLAAGFRAEVRYTVSGRPDVTAASPAFHRRARKAQRAGFTAEVTTDLDGVFGCLADTSGRKDFSLPATEPQLRELQAALGPDRMRLHVVRSPSGEVVGAAIQLLDPGGAALHWLQGTKRDYLPQGVSQLVHHLALTDLAALGVTTFDLGGANIPALARAKLGLGLQLTPYLALQQTGVRTLTRDAVGTARTYGRQLRRRTADLRRSRRPDAPSATEV